MTREERYHTVVYRYEDNFQYGFVNRAKWRLDEKFFTSSITFGHARICKLLLTRYNIDVKPPKYYYLNNACIRGHDKVVKILLSVGASIDNGTISSVMYDNQVEIIRLLLSNGQNIISAYNLQQASGYGGVKIFKLLLNAGISVHINNNFALKNAVKNSNTQIVKILLKAGVTVRDDIVEWIEYKDTEIVRMLLYAGVNVLVYGYAIIEASKGGYLETVKLLLDNGADIHINEDNSL
jgi:ankyrin repeat protein